MEQIKLDIQDDLVNLILRLKGIDAENVEVHIPEGSVLFENSLNIKILKREAEKLGKNISFFTHDKAGNVMFNMLEKEATPSFSDALEGDLDEISSVAAYVPKATSKKTPLKDKLKLKPFATMKGGRKKAKLATRLVAILIFVLAAGGVGAYQFVSKVPKAELNIVVESQDFIKSMQVRVVLDGANSSTEKAIRGYGVETLTTNLEKIPTTGEKTIGEKAEGRIKIFNKTSSEKEFKKGQKVAYKNGGKTYEFTLSDSVTVPARTEDVDTLVITPGEKEVDVDAADIGEEYNIDKDKNFTIDKFKDDDFTAKSVGSFKGGKSEKIKIVAQADLDQLKTLINQKNNQSIEDELEQRAPGNREYIKGSIKNTVVKEEYSHKLDDEAEEVSLTQEVNSKGLAYSESDLGEILQDILKDQIPEGYELSSKDTQINAEILGNTETTVLNNTNADIQATIKASVIPIIDEERIKENIAGKKIEEAEKTVNQIQNITSYNISINPNIPLVSRIPFNKDNISINIEKKNK